jgi:CrcB protein
LSFAKIDDKILLIGWAVAGRHGPLCFSACLQATHTATFPIGTLVVNTLGCFIIGLFSYLADVRGMFTPEMRMLTFTGFLGGFTTFSTFGNETMALLRDGETGYVVANVSLHIVLGLGAVWAGRALAGPYGGRL